MTYNRNPKLNNGFITLLSTLIVAAVGLSIGVSLLLLGLGSTRTSFAIVQAAQARGLANACAETALELIRENSAFTGSGNLSIGVGGCEYTVTDTGGTSREISASGTVGTIIRKIFITLDVIIPPPPAPPPPPPAPPTPPPTPTERIDLNSWEEVAD